MKLFENDYDFTFIVYPPVPEEVGSLTAYQCYDALCYNNTNIEIGPCDAEKAEYYRAYWVPRVGEEIFN